MDFSARGLETAIGRTIIPWRDGKNVVGLPRQSISDSAVHLHG